MTTTVAHNWFKSPLGEILLTASDGILTGCYFANQKHYPVLELREAESNDDIIALGQAAEQLSDYFRGSLQEFSLAMKPQGTEFQQRVWGALREIPFGTRVTYSSIARRIDSPASIRAVGGAISRNPISIAIPCHRVVGSGGDLVGFAGGIERKRWLLELEAAGRSSPVECTVSTHHLF